jgi:putative protease
MTIYFFDDGDPRTPALYGALMDPSSARRLPEILAPAGDEAAMRAAIAAGANAVYFGLKDFNARARATNFDGDALGQTMALLHDHGV